MTTTIKDIKFILEQHEASLRESQHDYGGVYTAIISDPCSEHDYTVEIETSPGDISGVFHCADLLEAEQLRETITYELKNLLVKNYRSVNEWEDAVSARDDLVENSINKTIKDIKRGFFDHIEILVINTPRKVMANAFSEDADIFMSMIKEDVKNDSDARIRKFFNGLSMITLRDYVR